MKKAHKETLDIVSPPKSVDPLTQLPRELAETILGYLTFRQRMNACLVSPGWTQFIRSAPQLWSHLDLSGAKKKVRTAFISRAINSGRGKVRKASLSMLWDFDKTLKALVKHCPLEDLALLECGLQGDNLLDALAPAKYLRRIHVASQTPLPNQVPTKLFMLLGPRLDSWSVDQEWKPLACRLDEVIAPRMLNFSMTSSSAYLVNYAASLAPSMMPSVRALSLRYDRSDDETRLHVIDLAKCKQLSTLDLDVTYHSLSLLTLPVTLRKLTLRLTGFMYSSTPLRLQPGTALSLPVLEEVDLSFPQFDTVKELIDALLDPANADSETLSKLRRMALRRVDVKKCEMATMLDHARLRDITHFTLQGLGVTDDVALEVVKAHPHLQYLDLSQSKITGVGVKEAMKAKELRQLVLNDCSSLQRDAIDYARSRGISVTAVMKSENGGRKVRY